MLGLVLFYTENTTLKLFLEKIINEYNLKKESENISLIYANKKILRRYWNQLIIVYPRLIEYKFNYHDFWNIDEAVKHEQ